MSKGKYSPSLTRDLLNRGYDAFIYNADKQISPKNWADGEYDVRKHFANYDADGFDSYGYSAFNADGVYVGIGDGIDRWGYTEMDYLIMSDDEFNNVGP